MFYLRIQVGLVQVFFLKRKIERKREFDYKFLMENVNLWLKEFWALYLFLWGPKIAYKPGILRKHLLKF